jgi:hypothetical protein
MRPPSLLNRRRDKLDADVALAEVLFVLSGIGAVLNDGCGMPYELRRRWRASSWVLSRGAGSN